VTTRRIDVGKMAEGLGLPITNGNGHDPASCWHRRADELAGWTERRMVNRRDVSGGYSLDSEGKASPFTSHNPLSHDRIIRHYRATSIGDVLGLHTTARVVLEPGVEACLSLWGAADIDQHGEVDFSQANEAAAKGWYDVLVGLGFHPLLIDSNGRGGFHLRVLLEDPTLTPHVRQLFRWLLRDWKERGLEHAPEVFPKQPEITPSGNGSCGNWLRLPGRHPKRDHWPRVWDGSEWLDGDEAIDFALNLTGDPAQLIPNEALVFEPEHRQRTTRRVDDPKTADDVQNAREALAFLNQNKEAKDRNGQRFWDEYDPWLMIGMALYDLGEPGLDLWLEWSREHPKYQASGKFSCEEKWETFSASGDNGVSLGTVFYYAKAHGWIRPKRRNPAFRNFYFVKVKVTDKGGKEHTELEPRALSLPKIIGRLLKLTGGWPKRVSEELFVASKDHRAVILSKPAALFGWLANATRIDWRNSSTMITQDQLFEHLRKFSAERYDAIEHFPHWPPVDGVYYLHPPVELKHGGKLLDRFLKFFEPATDQDRELIKAAILTMFWGGPPGKRPVIRIEGPEDDDPEKHGRGVGKSTIPERIGSLCGGHVGIHAGGDMEKFKTRLLSSEDGAKRIVLLDNLKTRRFSWDEYEALVTGSTISGHKMWVGEGQRPNLLTHFITVNSGALSKDMCQRSVTIRVKRPKYSASWDIDIQAFVEAHRWEIIAEIGGILVEDLVAIAGGSRWALWEHQVLSRCDHFDACRKLIKDRAEGLDDDDETAFEFEQMVANILRERSHDPDKDTIWISSSTIGEWLSIFKAEPRAACTATSTLQLWPLRRLKYKRTKIARGWTWVGEHPAGDQIDLKPPIGDE
jgi:Primase C terminal 2 (PriCT-2)